MTCLTCCKLWTAEDAEADADEIKVEAKGGVLSVDRTSQDQEHQGKDEEKDQGDIVIEVNEEQQEEVPQAEATREAPPTAEEVASAIDVEEVSKEAAPSSGGSGVLSASQADATKEAVKRVDSELMEGGMLLTQVMGERKAIRRLEVESDSGVLKWEVEAVFGMKWERVNLARARMMYTGNLVKIGVEGRSEFMTFEACDDKEAAAVCDALVGHSKKHRTMDL
eukprot:g11317.t1